MTYHIYNGERIVDKIYYEFNIIKGKHHNKELDEQIDNAIKNIINTMNEEAKRIEIRGVLKQRINTFRADQLECMDIRRYWSEIEYINIARSIPTIEEFLKEIYKENYTTLVNKLITYKSIMNDIKYRMDLIINNKYTITNPEQAKFIHETEQKISKIQLINEEVKRIGLLLDMFTSMGDMTVPSTTLQQARAKFRKIEYEQQDRRETNREFIMGGGEQ
jgi:hypothetical protein